MGGISTGQKGHPYRSTRCPNSSEASFHRPHTPQSYGTSHIRRTVASLNCLLKATPRTPVGQNRRIPKEATHTPNHCSPSRNSCWGTQAPPPPPHTLPSQSLSRLCCCFVGTGKEEGACCPPGRRAQFPAGPHPACTGMGCSTMAPAAPPQPDRCNWELWEEPHTPAPPQHPFTAKHPDWVRGTPLPKWEGSILHSEQGVCRATAPCQKPSVGVVTAPTPTMRLQLL